MRVQDKKKSVVLEENEPKIYSFKRKRLSTTGIGEKGQWDVICCMYKILYISLQEIIVNDMTVTNISEFRANVKRYVDEVINNSSSLVINRGNTAAVLISLDEYNSIKETERIISTPGLSGSLDEGLDEFKERKTISVDIDEL